jgi:hypothetical protein
MWWWKGVLVSKFRFYLGREKRVPPLDKQLTVDSYKIWFTKKNVEI